MSIELIGTIASIIILISFLFNKVQIIRTVNIIGCIVFITYGLLIKSFSICFLNTALAIIHILKIIKENKKEVI